MFTCLVYHIYLTTTNKVYRFFLILFFFSEEEKAVFDAVDSGDLERLKVLLETRDDKNPIVYVGNAGGGFSVLDLAANNGHVNIIEWYDKTLHFDDINLLESTGAYTPMMYAAQAGALKVVQYYIKNVPGG